MDSSADLYYGPIFIGFIFNLVLYGITWAQTLMYFQAFPRDRKSLKGLVAFLFLADTANAVFNAVYLYKSLITHFGDVARLLKVGWIFETDPATTGIIASVVQLFYAWRVKTLTGNVLAFIVIISTSVASFLGAVGTTIAVTRVPFFVEFQKFQVIIIVWLACAAVCDVLITCALVWYLRRHKSGFAATDDIMNRIIRLTVQTGLITSSCATLDLILFLVNPHGLHLIFNIPLSKLYTNTLLSSLNSRRRWSGNRSTSGPNQESQPAPPVCLNELHGLSNVRASGNIATNARSQTPRVEAFVHVESREVHDYQPKGMSAPWTSDDDLSLEDNSFSPPSGDTQWKLKSDTTV